MSLELVNTIASTLTAIVIAGTATAALIQLRHMRAGNQISALLTLRSMLDEPGHRAAISLIHLNLEWMIAEPGFRSYLAGESVEAPDGVRTQYEEMASAAHLLGNTYDAIGTLIRNDIIDRQLFLEQYCSVIDRDWSTLETVTDYARVKANDPGIWEDFEYLTVLARQFLRDQPTSYPADMPRLEPRNPWRTNENKTLHP